MRQSARVTRMIGLAVIALFWGAPNTPTTRAESPPLLATSPSTWYVRADGGDCAQCDGTTDAPYAGVGTNQPCAWRHPYCALPPGGQPRMAGGDTLFIGPGSYRMGYGATGTDNCSSYYPWDCHMPPIPSGPDANHPTRILGVGWDDPNAQRPELWGAERAGVIINLDGSHHVVVAGLELTDHSGCVESHAHGVGGSQFTCQRDSYPYGDWAAVGVYAEDSGDVTLRNLDIHGLASAGVRAGRLSDWLIEDVRISGNGWVGWDGDISGDDWNSGDLVFRRVEVSWNGCAETWPGGEPAGCWGQRAGGYGDGLGTGATGGNWLFEDSRFEHNTSDGLDLLYCREPSTITIKRTLAAHNAGNQLKTSGPATIQNSVVVGDCGCFHGQPYTYAADFNGDGVLDSAVDDCRALGNALSLSVRPGDALDLLHNTVIGQGDCLVLVEASGAATGVESVSLRNNLFLGELDYLGGDRTCLIYSMGFPHDPVDVDYVLVTGAKHGACPGDHALCEVDPLLADSTMATFNGRLLALSPAIDFGDPTVGVAVDFDGHPRDANPDLGAFEWRENSLVLPLVVGWNLIALPGLNGATPVDDALAEIAGAYDLVYAWDADSGWLVDDGAGGASDTLASVDATMGLWVRATQATTLTQNAGNAPSSVPLRRGWNLVGAPLGGVAAPVDAVVSAGEAFGGQVARAYAWDAEGAWSLWDPSAPGYVGELRVVEPGRGYWVQASADGVWRTP